MADRMQFNQKTLEVLGMNLLGMIEEEMINLTYGTTRFIKQGLDAQKQFQANYSFSSKDSFLPNMGSLANQLADLTQQLRQRNYTIAQLEERLTKLEANATAQTFSEVAPHSAGLIAEPDTRISAIEESLGSVELLAGELGQRGEDMSALNQRVARLEEFLQPLSTLPELLDRQSQIITRLEERVGRLEGAALN